MLSINLLPDVKKDLLKVRRERNLVVSISIIAVGVSVAILVILGGTLGGLTVAKTNLENKIDDYESTIKKAQEEKQLNEYLTVQNQLKQIDGLKGDQRVYSRLMNYLTDLNPAAPNSVSLSTVTLSAGGEEDDYTTTANSEETTVTEIDMTIEGTTADFAALDVYKNTLEKAQLVYETKSDDESASDEGEESDEDKADQDSSDGLAASNGTEATKENLFTYVSVDESNLTANRGGSMVAFTITVTFNEKAFDASVANIKLEVPKETTSDGDRNAPTETFNTEDTEVTDETTTEGGDK